jgi:type I restriction enzyme R subunit
LPKLKAAGCEDEMIREQMHITAGKIIPKGRGWKRLAPKKPDYTLFYAPNSKIAVVEAKSIYSTWSGDATSHRVCKDACLAYSTNGKGIEEYDFLSKKQSTVGCHILGN